MSASRSGLRAVFASVAALGLATAGSGIASATTISPPEEGVTATGTGAPALTLRSSGYVMECYTFQAVGETPLGGDSVTLAGGDVEVADCFMNGTYSMNIDVHEDLELVVDYNDGAPQGSLVIPEGGMTAWYASGASRCNLEVNASTVGPVGYDNATGVADVVNQAGLNYTSGTTGVIICPPSGTALVTITLQLELDGGDNPVVGP